MGERENGRSGLFAVERELTPDQAGGKGGNEEDGVL